MDKNNIINNWNDIYKDYARLNPDLVLSGINTKRALLNHYLKYGYNENRIISDNLDNFNNFNNTNNIDNNDNDNKNIIIKSNLFILTEEMIIENI